MKEDASTDSLDKDTIFDLLSSERRRYALRCLADHGALALPDLADEVAAREHDAPLPQISDDVVLRIYLSLYHKHVPKLAEADVVTYDQDQDIVALGEHAEPIKEASPFFESSTGD